MKFIASSGQLLKALQTVGGVIQTNNTLPILDHFLLELSQGQLTLTASDLETTMTTTLDIETEGEITAAIPARILLDTVKSFPEQPLTFTLNPDKHSVEVSSDYGKYALSYVDATEYPKAAALSDAASISMPANVLTSALHKTLFAAGNDDLRPVMSGVFFQLTSDGLTFVATDAHMLVRYVRTDIKASNTSELIIPKKPLNQLKATLGQGDDIVTMHVTEQNAQFSYGNVTLICRLIDGKYPNFEAVIPKDNPNKLTVDRGTLLSSVKRVSLFANKTTHQIRFKITGNELTISAEDPDFANKAHERLTCQYDGSDMEIGFNSRFIVEMLNNLTSDDVVMELSAPNRAGLLFPESGLEDGESILMLVMPVMLNQ
ncbi:MAG: DNA polymerase III subunit beta [Schleiferiaceae bacterium]|nr:DNA polymerase III subunit beta [Schleiferiaceae bacterium]